MGTTLEYAGWSSFIFTSSDGTRMITDPFLKGNEKYKISPSPMNINEIFVDLIICSHCSDDHFAQTFEIMDNSPKTKLLGDLSVLALAERAGYGNMWEGRTELITSGATYTQNCFTIHATSARHIAFQRLDDGSFLTGEPMCYIIQIKDGPTCFFGGDTSLTCDMQLWGKIFKPDIAFVGIGGADIRGRCLSELNPYTAAMCVDMLGVKKVIPMHYRTEDAVEEFKEQLKVICPSCELLVMKPMDVIEI